MDVILSTRNPSKALQIQTLFEGSQAHVLTLADAAIEGEAVENGITLYDNASLKARFAFTRAINDVWTMADDTGIFINALGGEPGVYSARWAGESASTEDITRHCLDRLRNADDRSAIFRTVVSLIAPNGTEQFFVGEVTGYILEAPRVPPQPKMPYSPIFVPDGQDKCWAEMTTEEENAISHRGKAFRQVREFLSSK
jgi:XTP/dITP diphosphohydrolase